MKKIFTSMFLIALMLMALAPITSFAQTMDTVAVSALPPGNLNTVINSDTTAGGFLKPNTVYLLKQTTELDTVYWMTAPISAKGDIRVVGEINPTTGHPPVVAPFILDDNSSIGHFFEPQGDATLELRGIYFLGKRTDGLVYTGRFIVPAGDNNNFIFDRCIIENISGAGTPDLFDTWGYVDNSYYITNCEFRNNQGDNADSPGFSWLGSGEFPCDTAKFVNNTFFISGGCILGADDFGCKYLEFDHNTIFFSTQGGVFNLPQMTNAVITNNIFFSASSAALPESWYGGPGTWGSALIPIDSLRSLAVDPYNLTEAERNITITNNAYFWSQEISDKWAELDAEGIEEVTPLRPPDFINAQPGILTDNTTWPNVNVADNYNTDPGFDAALVQEAGSKMATFVDTLWHNDGTGMGVRPFVGAFDNPPTWEGVASDWASTQGYPVPENLRYTNTALQTAGTDGKPLGDLNWFPEQMTAINKNPNPVPSAFSLSQNYPNPFNSTTNLKYSLAKDTEVSLKIYNMLGKEIRTLVNEKQTSGYHAIQWDGTNNFGQKVTSGIYFYTFKADGVTKTKKMIMMK